MSGITHDSIAVANLDRYDSTSASSLSLFYFSFFSWSLTLYSQLSELPAVHYFGMFLLMCPHSVVLFFEDGHPFDNCGLGAGCSGSCVFLLPLSLHILPWLHGFSLGTTIFSHIPKICTWGELASKLFQSERIWVWVHPVMGRWPVLYRANACLLPWATGIGSGLLCLWTGIIMLENNDLTFLLTFLKCMYSLYFFSV